MPELPVVVTELTARQCGTVSRQQLLARGVRPDQIRSWRRHRLLVPLMPGVYLDHTGQPTPEQRRWAAVLWAAPAALCGPSALRAEGLLPRSRSASEDRVHVMVDADRKLVDRHDVAVTRCRAFDERVAWHRSPPRTHLEDAVIDVATGAARESDAVAVLAEAVSSRRTTAGRLRHALERRTRAERRAFVLGVLADVEAGVCSVLEHRYLTDVVRAHGLPGGRRQVRASARGTIYRDVDHEALGLVIELDGRLDHDHVLDRARDLDRDLDAAEAGRTTVRLGWLQVVGRACATARVLAALMTRLGWSGRMRTCPRCP